MMYLSVMPKKAKITESEKCANKYEADFIKELVEGNAIMLRHIRDIKDILHDEGCNNSSFTTQEALDLDKVETDLAKKERRVPNNTVDFVVGLCQKFTLLVEAKLRAESPQIFYHGLDDKIKYSRCLLVAERGFRHFDLDTVVLLKDEKFEQNKNKLMRLIGNKPILRPLRVNDFYNRYFA